DKFSNVDDYDLILEEKEKELKKEKRNKVILASSLALLLLLGSTAAVAPIISVAVNNKNIHNSSNSNGSNNDGSNGSNNGGSIDIPANIPNQLTFTDSDITTLINGYQDEIKLRKLVYDQFQNDFTNITRKHITASNISIGSLVKNATIQKVVNNNQTNFNISITLDENNREYFYMDLTKAQLNKNVLSFTLTENTDLTFSTIIKVTVDQLNKIKDEIQKYVDDTGLCLNNIYYNYNSFVETIVENQLNIKKIIDLTNTEYEWSKLTITPRFPYVFECDSVTDMIVDGNIVISDLTSKNRLVIFHNLIDVYNLINDSVFSYSVDEFKLYLKNNQENFKQFLVDNLVIENNDNDFTIDTITNITWDEKYNRVIIEFKTPNTGIYFKTKVNIDRNKLSLVCTEPAEDKWKIDFKNLDFNLPGSPLNWFTYNKANGGYEITGLTELGKQQSSFQFNKKMKYFAEGAFSDCDNIVTVDFSLVESEGVINYLNLSKDLFNNCKNLQNVIFSNMDCKIGDSAFKDCSKLQTTDLLSNALEIGDCAFYNCTSLSSSNVITISKTSKIGNYAFANCTGLKKVDARGSCERIGNNAFENSGLIWFKGNANNFKYVIDGVTHKDVIYLDGAYYLGFDAFKNCTNLQWVEFRGGYEWGNHSPFSGCNGINYYTAVKMEWTFPPQVGKPTIDGHYIRDIYGKQDQTGISQFLTSSTPE
ncbi:MAG: leucine-rich repeat domain-containing protein, partial [Ureaplasma sp.]|nr:leucine-rich repeat domain-containing protein [Ureaplasma sp.]